VLELSTPELDDVTRWEDDYGRAVQERDGGGWVREGRRRPAARSA
jgi:hypothetical protein